MTSLSEATTREYAVKACSQCRTPKPLSEFFRQARAPGGLRPECKECSALSTLEARAAKGEAALRYPMPTQNHKRPDSELTASGRRSRALRAGLGKDNSTTTWGGGLMGSDTREDGSTRERQCRGCHEVKPWTREHFSQRGGGQLRTICRACSSAKEQDRQNRMSQRGLRKCLGACGRLLTFADFDAYMRDGERQMREKCRECSDVQLTPLEEAEVEHHKQLRSGFRSAIAMQILLGRRGMSLADYKALRGEARLVFEQRWSALMIEMADDVGELFRLPDPVLGLAGAIERGLGQERWVDEEPDVELEELERAA